MLMTACARRDFLCRVYQTVSCCRRGSRYHAWEGNSMTTRMAERHPLRFLAGMRIDSDVSLSFRRKVLAAICWGCVVGDHIAYLFRTTSIAQLGFNVETIIGIEVYVTVAALVCWRVLTTRSSQRQPRRSINEWIGLLLFRARTRQPAVRDS